MKVQVEAQPVETEKEDGEKYDQWQLKSFVNTILEAEEIKADPEIMALIKPILQKKAAAAKKITSLSGLKAAAKKRIDEIDSEE